jgi:hypothetical protein
MIGQVIDLCVQSLADRAIQAVVKTGKASASKAMDSLLRPEPLFGSESPDSPQCGDQSQSCSPEESPSQIGLLSPSAEFGLRNDCSRGVVGRIDGFHGSHRSPDDPSPKIVGFLGSPIDRNPGKFGDEFLRNFRPRASN